LLPPDRYVRTVAVRLAPAVPRARRQLLTRRVLFLILADAVACVTALVASLLIRFEGVIEERYREALPAVLGPLVLVRILLLFVFGLYHVQWRYAGIRDLVRLAAASGASSLLLTALTVFLQIGGFVQVLPRSVIVVDFLLFSALAGLIRMTPRILSHLPAQTAGRTPALVYGAGAAGEQIVRDMHRHPEYPYYPAGLLDDDPLKWNTTIHGVRVLGDSRAIPHALDRTGAQAVIVAIPSARASQVRPIVEAARAAGVQDIRILPGLDQILTGEVTVSQVRQVELVDLLGREQVRLDTSAIEEFLRGKRILVTGATGSIGSELARQILRFSPSRLAVLDHDETELHYALERFGREPGIQVEGLMGDVRDAGRIGAVFESFRPQVVFHAAAYKHVPLLEEHPAEGVKTNILGTRIMAIAAARSACEKFVLISTDKAVNPTSVMGATKRVAEMVIREAGHGSRCLFEAVRFGNVLGSRGSVVLTFQDQIARGGPVTVTHADMKRYFMTIPEACLLVLQAASLGRGGEVFVLDMGEPVRILDLARDMIRFSGFEPGTEIAIEFTGIRPGEKLFEEYLTAEEGVDSTLHEKIFVARITHDLSGDLLAARLLELEQACNSQDSDRIRSLLCDMIPTYRPSRAGAPEPSRDSASTS
jgi:FlaA1/EpsC-like NDP-sugar epimerase